jgi:integrase
MPNASPAVLRFTRSQPEKATLEDAICAYLQHMQRKKLRRNLSPAHYDNVSRFLRNLCAAWRVVFADGRQALLPAPAPPPANPRYHRRPPPRIAADAAEAIAWATELFRAPGPEVEARALRNGDTAVADAITDDLDLWLLANPQWQTQNAQANACAAILNCFGWYADTTGTRSPYRRRLAPKFHRECRRNATQEEYEAMVSSGCSENLRLALWCLWHVDGIRPAEMYGMRWTYFKRRSEVSSTLEVPHKTQQHTGKPKVIPLTPRTLGFFLELWRLRRGDGESVFCNTHGTPWKRVSFDQHFRHRRQGLGLACDLTPYCFRHSFATDAVRARVDKGDVATLLGHANKRMLDTVYSHADDYAEHLCRVAIEAEAKIDDLRQGRRRKTPAVIQQGELW